jgi:hypothetical protein
MIIILLLLLCRSNIVGHRSRYNSRRSLVTTAVLASLIVLLSLSLLSCTRTSSRYYLSIKSLIQQDNNQECCE